MEPCPCGSGLEYTSCCEAIIQGTQAAATPALLMRARYSAYVKGEVKFLLRSIHPRKRHDMNEKDIQAWSANSEWHGLEILSTEGGGPDDQEGMVEFVAHYSQGENKYDHRERAHFKREEGAWYFLDGKVAGHEPFIRPTPKIGRNDPCSCGSGKKYKKCCGK
jgi:SEC-C motif-containing protein